MVFPPGDNNPIDIYPVKHPLDGTEMLEIWNEGTTKLYGVVDDIVTLATLASGNQVSVDAGVGVASLSIPLSVNVIRTTGYYVAGDGGGALYKRVTSQPAHAGKWQSADGAWWEYVPDSGETNVLAFGADPSGVVSSSTAINHAIAYAATFSPMRAVYAPRGNYKIATEVTIPTLFAFRGDGTQNTIFIPTMTDGTACIRVAAAGQFVTLRDFAINSGISMDVFRAGTLAPNCVGLQMSDPAPDYGVSISRWYVENINVYGCRTGVHFKGWIGTAINLWIVCCEIGLRGEWLNGVSISPRIEVCRQSFYLTESYAVTILNLQDEGDCLNKIASTVDYCTSVTFLNPYWEAGTQYPLYHPHVVIGGSVYCRNVIMTGVFVETNNLQPGMPAIDFQSTYGMRIDGYVGDGELGTPPVGYPYRITANCSDVSQSMSSRTTFYHYMDDSRELDAVINYFPNPYFECWLRGWSAITLHNATFARNIYTTRRGRNSVTVTASAGTNNNYIAFHIQGIRVLQQTWAERTFRVGAWIFIPDITEFNAGTHTATPDISMYVTDGSATLESASRAPGHLMPGSWNFIYSDYATPQTLVNDVQIRIWVNRTSHNCTGNEYIVVDNILVCDAHVPIDAIMHAQHKDDEFCPKFIDGVAIMGGRALPADANQLYERGDQILRDDVGPGESPGWVCIGGAVGGDATAWEPMPCLEQRVTYLQLLNLPALPGTRAGARIFVTNALNATETTGNGTGCWCYLNSAGAWLADWSGLVVTA